MAMKPMTPVPSSPMGALTRRRPLLTLKPKRFDDGGLIEKDIDVAPVDRDFSIDVAPGGGFLGSPEMGPARGDPANPNNSSGLTAAMDSLSGERSIAGQLADFALGSRSLSFDPVTGTFSDDRDWGKTAIEKAAPMMFGPLGPIVSVGMRAANAYGEPISDDRVGRGPDRGVGMRDGGRVHLADGGGPVPPQVAALIAQAMAAKGGNPPPPAGGGGGMMPPGAPPAPPPEPSPLDFIPSTAELVRRYGGGGQQAVADAALAQGGAEGGGTRSGLLRGPGGGRDDLIPAELEPNGFVYPARRVAEKGGGSVAKGAARIAAEVGDPDAARPVPTVQGGPVPAKVSNGEVYLSPAAVERAGGASALEADIRPRRRRGKKR